MVTQKPMPSFHLDLMIPLSFMVVVVIAVHSWNW